jgi:uncharacterized integral membrane protein
MARAGFTAPGQREQIVRGERTDPRAVIVTGVAIGAVGAFIVLLIMGLIMLNVRTSWAYIVKHWRWLIIFPLLPWIAGGCFTIIVLYVEINDPNWPPPRDATPSTAPLHPLSKERMQPKGRSSRIKLTDLLNALDLELESEPDELD